MVLIKFPEVTQRRYVHTFCRKCKKKRQRVLVRKWYRNGLHDEEKTRKKNDAALDAEAKKLRKNGIVCNSCQ